MRQTGLSRFLSVGTTLFVMAAVGCSLDSPASQLTDPERPGSSACPNRNALGKFQPADNVAASFSVNGKIATYSFAAVNENSAGGVPGLIKYCVYSTPAAKPTDHDVQATGANGALWTFRGDSGAFSFGRPDGDPSNIPLDGNTTVIGTATWAEVPGTQTILLHINDPAVCANLYGGDPGTCFVKSGQTSACILDRGETNVAYNAMPFGAADCGASSLGFEATGTKEFGDEVQLAGSTRRLVSLKVLFSSWACESGHWFDGACSTSPGATFTHDVTANIYAVAVCGGNPCPGALLASVTETQTVPYRPSTDPQCAVLNPADPDPFYYKYGWFNPVVDACKPQIPTVLTFDFTSKNVTLPDEVIWTVAFNTTHYGAAPIGQGAACFTGPGGCPYDSFNVGAQTYPGAPYAGIDVQPDTAFVNGVGEKDWANYRPLGEIITK
ncbi:MAG TPA: hypothetical protein VKP10_04585 [Gemmatimonadales bacterium]|nr:hypothetical protein [Gemmatimonadales bacterium]